jgi:hypothetical protein
MAAAVVVVLAAEAEGAAAEPGVLVLPRCFSGKNFGARR